jgi:hypothetical protein
MHLPAIEVYIRGEIAKGRPITFENLMAHMNADRTPVEDAGRIAQKAGVKTLVLSHLIPAFDSISDDTWRGPAAKYFKDRTSATVHSFLSHSAKGRQGGQRCGRDEDDSQRPATSRSASLGSDRTGQEPRHPCQ